LEIEIWKSKKELLWYNDNCDTIKRMSRFFAFLLKGTFILYAGINIILPAFFSFNAKAAEAKDAPASLFVSPSSATFTTGSTFTISVFVNTAGQSINAIQADIRFPPNKLQVVSHSGGKSIIGVWVAQPSYDNRLGTIKFQGAIPSPGINTTSGLIAEITFRVISTGTAIVKFEDTSKILLNDGKGTDVLGQTTGGVYQLVLPPPAGPTVSSPTHPDQEKWYANRSVTLIWGTDEAVEGYSYELSDRPIDIPDDTSEGFKTVQTYQNVPDGIHYFHIKSIRNGSWGGVSHFAVRIDGSPPARFKIDVSPGENTVVKKPVISFETTDAHSGVEHYETKIVPLTPISEKLESKDETTEYFFTEQHSPYTPELAVGEYDILVRAYDFAGNYTEEVQRISILPAVLWSLQARGIQIGTVLVPWVFILSIAGVLVLISLAFAWHFIRWHRGVDLRHRKMELPPEIKEKLDELKMLREKYKGLMPILFAFFFSTCFLTIAAIPAYSAPPLDPPEEVIELAPPIVTSVSRNISNKELLYIGGKVAIPKSEVKIFLQNLETGETTSYNVTSDAKGDWFYSHRTFLQSGKYLIWTQTRLQEATSPPSPQIPISVSAAALQFGASRLSYESIYLGAALALFALVVLLGSLSLYHYYHGKKKHNLLLEEIRKSEAMIHRGFAVLKKDIEAELAMVKRARASGTLSEKEKEQEEKILEDLQRIERYIGKELWEIEHTA